MRRDGQASGAEPIGFDAYQTFVRRDGFVASPSPASQAA